MRGTRGTPAPRGLRPLAVAPLALALVLIGCTGQPWDLDSASPSPAAASPNEPGAAEPPVGTGGLPGAVGRIAVLDAVGTLTTFAADGSGDPVVLDASEPDEVFVRQPTWSADGRIAWVRIGDHGTSATLHTTEADGTRPTETPIAAAPFYLSWDPTSSRIVYLGGSANADIELGLVDVTAGTAAVPLDDGSPFYLSWNPSGRQLLIHVGTDRLDRLSLDGTATAVGDAPGMFSAPVWTADGRTFVYAAQTQEGQRLVARDRDADRGQTLARFEGAIAFVVSPDGRRVAFQVIDGQRLVVPLSVVDRRTGAIERVAESYSPAFFWSPSGAKLLALLPELEGEAIWFRWGVWEDGASFRTGERFVPSLEFSRDYLQFFEQYAQSMRLWSPDEAAFVYAGQSESGASGVWIQPATQGASPVLVAEGVFATWSP
jgi:TolB protein